METLCSPSGTACCLAVVSVVTLGTLGHFSTVQVLLGGQPGGGHQRPGPSFVTSKPPVLLFLQSSCFCAPRVSWPSAPCLAVCPPPHPVLTLSPARAFTCCLPLLPLSFVFPLHGVSFCHCCFPSPLSFMVGSFPSFCRRPAPQQCCQGGTAPRASAFFLQHNFPVLSTCPAQLRPWDPIAHTGSFSLLLQLQRPLGCQEKCLMEIFTSVCALCV